MTIRNEYGHTAVVYGDKVYIWGGRNDRASCSTLFCFDTVWHCWTAPKTTGNIPPGRDGHTACMWKNYMFIFGGYEEDSDAYARSVYSLDLDKMHWSYIHTTVIVQLQEIYPLGEEATQHLYIAKKMYIFGGYNSVIEQHFNDMYEFNPETHVWKKLNCLGKNPCERRRQACVAVGDRIFFFWRNQFYQLFFVLIISPQQSSKLVNIQSEDMDDKLIDHSDMYVLDFQPSLKTLCIIAVRMFKQDETVLPHNLKLDIMNMYTPNKITINRPNNSAG
ncbi:hypothetical protein NQ314_005266 [Rhamnusium bicolor]|uniref:Kelch domain-containing protein 3 n=1 Tax=Rhamnusium bicolor TaxID=1586634 RepID=A0AAV8ZHJ1_9CUCU|nr:hypothetical protein NQ314_005266 [Rhamnusium bicolor]